MKFTCQKSDLFEVLPNIFKATSNKTPMEALATIRMEARGNTLSLTGYDLELGIFTQIPASVEEEGSLLADGKLFCELIRRMPDGVLQIFTDEHLKITITGNETECQLAGMHADDYPDLPSIEQGKGAVIPQELLREMIEQTIYAVSLDETKPIFTGALFEIENETLSIVALDNYRMALRTESLIGQEQMKFVVPAKALREISHLLTNDDKNEKPCVIHLDQHQASFEINRYVVYTRLLAGEFINYRRSIPMETKTEILMSRKDLIGSLERCGLLITEQNKTPVRFQLDHDRMNISCVNVLGSVEDQLDCSITGESMVVGFNNRYLIDAVRVIQGDRVKIVLSAPDRAVRIMEADGDNYIAVIMPVQVRR